MAVSNLDFRKLFPSLTDHVDDSTVGALLSAMEEYTYSIGDTVIQDNVSSDKLFFILKGNLSSHIEKNGEKHRP